MGAGGRIKINMKTAKVSEMKLLTPAQVHGGQSYKPEFAE